MRKDAGVPSTTPRVNNSKGRSRRALKAEHRPRPDEALWGDARVAAMQSFVVD
jgi:hypothetical protein